MGKVFLLVSLFLLTILAACAPQEAKEIEVYQNGFHDKVVVKIDELGELYPKMDFSGSNNEDTIEIIQKEFLPTLDEIEAYMNSQNPKNKDTKEYHELRLIELDSYVELNKSTMQAIVEHLKGEMEEEVLAKVLEVNVFLREEEYERLKNKADDKLQELADKHELEMVDGRINK